jgi:undecaprenyl-diphosphatase
MDFTLARAINRLGAGFIDPATELFCAIAFLVAAWTLMLGVAVWRDRPRAREVSLGVVLALVTHFVVSEGVLKHGMLRFFSKRVRPWLAHPGEIAPVGFRFEDSSFPSSHAASTTAVLFVFGWHYPRARIPAALFVLLMAFARVHNGMHYPSDVLAGTLLGLGYGWLGVAAARALARRRGWPSGSGARS